MITVCQRSGISGAQKMDDLPGEFLILVDVITDRTNHGQLFSGLRVIKLRPQNSRRIHEIKTPAQVDPLFSTRHAGLISRLRHGFPRQGIDEG